MQLQAIRHEASFLGVYSSSCRSLLRKWRTLAEDMSTATVNIPVIKIPKRLEDKVKTTRKMKEVKGQFQWQGRVFNSRPGKEIISAKRKEFNYYQNQIYNKSKNITLASHGWKHRKSIGDYFTILAYRGNPSLQDDELAGKTEDSFNNYGLDKRLLRGLDSMEITKPTIIQNSAIPELQKGKNVLFAAETGSGKTLAYLLPVLDSLLRLRDVHADGDVRRPRGVILLPAQELAQQVHNVLRQLIKDHGMKYELLDGSGTLNQCKEGLEKPIDLLVATTGRLIMAVKHGYLSLKSVKHAVIDEVDTLLDDSFKSSTLHILKKMEISHVPLSPHRGGSGAQLILTGATMPRQAVAALEEVLSENSLEVISTPHLHRVQPHINQKFMRLPSQDKAVTLVEILRRDVKKKTRVMIFCNETSSSNWLAYLLEENNIECLRLNGGMKIAERRGVMDEFQSGSCDILVSTDVASRGIDTSRVEHVINFDFPNFMSDYIHRVGRVGRISSKSGGRVTSFVVHKWDVDLVNKIETAVRARQSLPRVDANIKRKHVLRNTDSNPFNQLLFE